MAEDLRNKTVFGYPIDPGHIAVGFPHRNPAPPHAHGDFSPRCRLVFVAIALFLLIITMISIVPFVVLHPNTPEFRVESAIFSPINATGSELTSTWDLGFRVTNPNPKFSISYDRIEASVLYGEKLALSTELVPPFFQTKRNETVVPIRLGVVGEYVGEGVVSEIWENRGRGSVNFGVRVLALVRFGSRASSGSASLVVHCESVEFGFSLNKEQSTLCHVHFD